MRRYGATRINDVRNVRFSILVQRGRHTDNDRIDLSQAHEISRDRQSATLDLSLNRLRSHMLDVGLAGIDFLNLDRINVQTEDRYAGFGELNAEGKPHITQTDDRNFHFLYSSS